MKRRTVSMQNMDGDVGAADLENVDIDYQCREKAEVFSRFLFYRAGRFGRPVQQQLFVQQSGKKPDKEIVQPDKTAEVETGTAVIPGTHIPSAQNGTAQKFSGHNKNGVDASA